MTYLAGFDPGGEGGFGWALVENSNVLPLNFIASGVADNCDDAWQAVANAVGNNLLDGVAIDSPLYWSATTRHVDLILRQELEHFRAKVPHGTVQAVNSLRGACLVQGILVARHARDSFPGIHISECHPKVIIWQLGFATHERHHNAVPIDDFAQFFTLPDRALLEHERDSVISTLSSWAMLHNPYGWNDLRDLDPGAYSPLGDDIAFWMPVLNHQIA